MFSNVTASISDDLRDRHVGKRCASGTCALTISPAITKQPRDACPGAISIDQLSVSDAIYAIASCAPWVGRLLLQVASEGRHVRFAAAAVLPSPIRIARSPTRPGTARNVRSQPGPEKTSRRAFPEDPRLRPRQEARLSLPSIVARRARSDATAIARRRRRVRGDNNLRWERERGRKSHLFASHSQQTKTDIVSGEFSDLDAADADENI